MLDKVFRGGAQRLVFDSAREIWAAPSTNRWSCLKESQLGSEAIEAVDAVSSSAEMLVEYGVPAAFAAVTLYLAWVGRKISLRDAAAQLYMKFRGTTVGSLMEGPVGTARVGVLDNAATHILHHLPFEVRRPPSRKWETLDPVALGGLAECGGATGLGLTACGGATGLRFVGRSDVAYPEVRVKARDLRRLIRAYQAEAHPLASFG